MKRIYSLIIAWILSLSFLTGCVVPPIPDIDVSGLESNVPTTTPLSNELVNGYYSTVLPVVSSSTRGLMYSFIGNNTSRLGNRFDIEELESSLARASTSVFDPNDYYLQEGQYLDLDLIRNLLSQEGSGESEELDMGLNPPLGTTIQIGNTTLESTENNPINYLAYLIEQNFITLDEEGERILEGVSIGLALNPYYSVIDENTGITQDLVMDERAIITEGEASADRLIETLRIQEGLESVPIMIGLYVLESDSASVPGRLVSKTWVEQDSNRIDSWESVNEQHVLLNNRSAATELSELDADILNSFNEFRNTLEEFYPNYCGVIGRAHFVDNSLYSLDISINTQFYGLAEKISFHQVVAELMDEFSPDYNITVTVSSSGEDYGVIQRLANEEVMVQIEGYYSTALPVVSSPTRGLMYSYIANSRLNLGNQFDIEEFEYSLMRASTRIFDPNEFYFQEGQYLERELVQHLLRREGSPAPNAPDIGLNPPLGTTHQIQNTEIESTEDNPITYLAYLTEQNYVTVDEEGEQVLEGVSIGLALNPHYELTDVGYSQNLVMDEQAIIAEGEAIAERLIENLRSQEGLESVPIMIGLYILESNHAYVPGRLVSQTLVGQGSDEIGNWESVVEQHFLLSEGINPQISELDPDIMDEFNYFRNTLENYFPHIYGIIGRAHMVNSNLYDLHITIDTEFYGLAEKMSVHQIVGEIITEFSSNYNVTVEIRSSGEIIGIIERPANEDAVVRRIGW